MFRTVVADPPWNERGGGKCKRGADRHYPLMKTTEIASLMECVFLTKHMLDQAGCHMYLWVTNNFLEDGLDVMKVLGFRYVTMRTWAKDRIGLGQYFRGQTEHVLFGVMGRQPAKVRTESTFIGKGVIPRGKHSEKPEQFYQEVELVSFGPYLELFARKPREGWTVWGNEVQG